VVAVAAETAEAILDALQRVLTAGGADRTGLTALGAVFLTGQGSGWVGPRDGVGGVRRMLEAVGDTMLGRVVTARAVVRRCGIFWRCGPAGCGGWALPVGFCSVAGTVLDMPFADVLGVELLHREAARLTQSVDVFSLSC
jgi:hypothetical protein